MNSSYREREMVVGFRNFSQKTIFPLSHFACDKPPAFAHNKPLKEFAKYLLKSAVLHIGH
jgi:hypothetical protein